MAGVIRRLHDTGRGFWLLPVGVGLPTVGSVILAIGFQLSGIGFLLGVFTVIAQGDQETLGEVERFFLLGASLIVLGGLAVVVGGILVIALLVFLATPGHTGENRYGPQPQ